MEAATAMDFQSLSRRELQALCKRNGIRANMTNVAMAEALQSLTTVNGIDEIGTTLCLPTPGRSAMKSAARMDPVDEQQHGSPLPRGRRVSVKSPEAIRMEVEGGEEGEMKEIVKTPGVALRSTRRGTRATPAPLPTPAPASSTRAAARRTAARKTGDVVPTPATRRSQRMASRKVAGAAEADRPAEDVPEEKTSKMAIAFDQEAEVAKVQEDERKAAVSDVKCDDPKEEKGQQEETKAVASDVKCDDREKEEEITKILEGDNKEEELEEGEEADSSDATTWSPTVLVKSCNDPKVEELLVVMEEQSTQPHEGIMKELDPISVERSALLTVMDDSPILGVIDKEQDASVEDCEDLEMTDEIIPVTGDKEVAISEEATEDKEVAIYEEAVKEDGFANTVETDPTPEEILTAAGEDETIEEGEIILTKGQEDATDEMLQVGQTSEEVEEDLTELKEGAADEVLKAELADNETSDEDEDDLSEDKEAADDEEWTSDDDENTEEIGSTDESDEDSDETNEESYTTGAVQILQGTGVAKEANEDACTEDGEEKEGAVAKMLQGELMEEDELDEDEEWTSDDDENTEEIDSADESNEDSDETNEESYTTGAVQILQGTGVAEEANEDASTEDDDFSSDLPPEFDNIMIFSDAETESDIAPPVLEENQAAVASATKIAKSLGDSAMNAEQEGPEEADDATEKAMKDVDNIVKSLDEFTFKDGDSEEIQKQQQDYNSMSLRKLKSTYKNFLIAAKEGKQEVTEGKRLPLEEVDENACVDH